MIRRIKREKNYTEVPNELAQDAVEVGGHLSGNAFMILVNIMSYPPSWKLYKTEIQKRYEKLKRTAVDKAWQELLETGYLLQYRYRIGKKYEYIYYMQMDKFTEEDAKLIEQELKVEFGDNLECWFSTVQNEQSKMNSSKPTANKDICIKDTEIKKTNKKNTSIVNNSGVNKSDLLDIIHSFYNELSIGRWTKEQWLTIANKLVDEIENNGQKIIDYKAYINACLQNICYRHDFKRGKADPKINQVKSVDGIPLYNWLETKEETEVKELDEMGVF